MRSQKRDHRRLEQLIALRLESDQNTENIDKQIWNRFGTTAAILFSDLSGFSRNVVKFGIIHFLQIIYESDRLFLPLIESHLGTFLKREGDSLLVIFDSVDQAVNCAVKMQAATEIYNRDHPDYNDILLCIGIGFGEIIKVTNDVFGKEVNFASRLGEDIAHTGEILLSESAAVNSLYFNNCTKLPKEISGLGIAYSLNYTK